MNIQDIKALAEVLDEKDLTVVEYEEGDLHIRLERAPARVAAPVQPQPVSAAPAAPVAAAAETNDFNNLCELKARWSACITRARAEPSLREGRRRCGKRAGRVHHRGHEADERHYRAVSGRIVDICAQDVRCWNTARPS
jgi:hypothetical protein